MRSLLNNQAHLWHVRLSWLTSSINLHKSDLPIEEQVKANAFKRLEDRNRYLGTRLILRVLISMYCRVSVDKISFDYGQYGKPTAIIPGQSYSLHFNISHSQDLLTLAFSRSPVGVDVEFVKPDFDIDSIANTVMSKNELEEFYSISIEKRVHAFYQLWTRKEALVKLLGIGMSQNLKSLEAGFSDDQSIRLSTLGPNFSGSDSREWRVSQIYTPEYNYVGAIALQSRMELLYCNSNTLWSFFSDPVEFERRISHE